MLTDITRKWWAVALRGLAAIVFGIAAFVWPQLTLTALVLLFGAYALVDGIFSLIYAFGSGAPFRGLLVVEGLISIIAGCVALVWPETATLAVLYLIAAWAVVTGIVEVVAAIDFRRVIENAWLLALGGIASIAFGVLLALQPTTGAVAVAWLIGAYALAFGVLLIALGYQLRSLGQRLAEGEEGGRRAMSGQATVQP
jgi:uncharacterized membrane protein HdeD (DUF308 family)